MFVPFPEAKTASFFIRNVFSKIINSINKQTNVKTEKQKACEITN